MSDPSCSRWRASRAVWLALVPVLALAGPATAVCNLIPAAVEELRSTSGTVDRPVATPGSTVTVRADLACNAAGPGFDVLGSANAVTLQFQPPGGAVHEVVVPPATVAVANCSPDRCDTLRFTIPDTDADLPPLDGLGRTGPARILIRRASGVIAAQIGPLFQPAASCEQPPAETVFQHFTVLPPANDFSRLTTKADPRILATIDGGGNLLIPFDFRAVLPAGSGAPVARIVEGIGRLVAFTADPTQTLVSLPSPSFVRAFSPIGRPVPPILQVADDGELIFGSVDADESVFRIARRDPQNGAAPAIFDLSDRLFQGAGPVLITDFDLASRQAAPLESLKSSGQVVALASDEGLSGELNGDADLLDRVVQVLEVATGAASNTARAVFEVLEGAVAKPILAAQEYAVFLESEAGQNDSDVNGDGDQSDTIFRIFRSDGLDLTAFSAPGEPLGQPFDVTADPEPAIDGRAVATIGRHAAFRSREGDENPKQTERVSVDGNFGDPNGISDRPDLSRDGRFVAFESSASDLVSGDSNGAIDVFVYDRVNDVTSRQSTTSSGAQVLGAAFNASISGDGQWVSWTSASSYDPSDGNGFSDVYLRRVNDDIVIPASIPPGLVPNGNSTSGKLNRDGSVLVFESLATNLSPSADQNGAQRDVFVYSFGSFSRASERADGVNGNLGSTDAEVSADGRFVLFSSGSTNLVPDDTNNTVDVYLKDRTTGALEIVSRGNGGLLADAQSGGSFGASVSGDGRYVAFASNATNLAPGEPPFTQIYVYDRGTQRVQLVSVGPDGAGGNASSSLPEISDDGRRVAFQSFASNLVPGDGIGSRDLFVVDRLQRVVEFQNLNQDGSPVFGGVVARDHAISGDGNVVAFESDQDLLSAPPDGNALSDVYARGTIGVVDLNEDGDASDSVLRVFDAIQQTLTTWRPVSRASMSELDNEVAIAGLVPERATGFDGNGDGDLFDEILWTFGPQTLDEADTGLAADNLSLRKNFLCFSVSEAAQLGLDRNGDGDATDSILSYSTPASIFSSLTLSTGLAVSGVAATPAACVARVREADQLGLDRNADGDALDDVMVVVTPQVFGPPIRTNLATAAVDFLAGDALVAFRSCEADQGGTDQNLDGDTDDCVMQVFPLGGQVINTRYAARRCDLPGCDPFFEPYRVGTNSVSFLVLESDQSGVLTGPNQGVGCLASSLPGECDLTGDGDSVDYTIVVFNVASGQAQVFEIAPPSPDPSDDPPISPFPETQVDETVLTVQLTEAQAGVDLDGDGELGTEKKFVFLAGDSDNDGAFDYSNTTRDVCRERTNTAQTDADGDGLGDGTCDPNPASVLPGDLPCEVDQHAGVDRRDVDLVFKDRGTTARASDARDPDGDGQVTVLDAAYCADQCDNADCGLVGPACGLLGLELLPLVAGAWWRRRRRAARGRALRVALLAVLAIGIGGNGAQALGLSLEPALDQVGVGGETVVRVVVSGLAGSEPPSLRSFDIDLAYDPAIVTFLESFYGDGLGLVSAEEVFQETRSFTGLVNLASVSLVSSPRLHAEQPGSFVLAELVFAGLAEGETGISLVRSLFGAHDGSALGLDGAVASAVIEVVIPEPGTALLAAAGLAALGVAGRRRRS